MNHNSASYCPPQLHSLSVCLRLALIAHPEATVEVIDTSLSITPRAEKAALDAVQNQIAHMQRGDTWLSIPITGDAANDAGGRILRLSAPTQRETYDTDLRRFHEQAQKQFTAWAASLDPHQSRTDILGALDAARQELALLPQRMQPQAHRRERFPRRRRHLPLRLSGLSLPIQRVPVNLARVFVSEHGFTLQGVSLCLGRLESSDFAPLSAQRKRPSRRSGRRTSPQKTSQQKSNSMAPAFSPTSIEAALPGRDSVS